MDSTLSIWICPRLTAVPTLPGPTTYLKKIPLKCLVWGAEPALGQEKSTYRGMRNGQDATLHRTLPPLPHLPQPARWKPTQPCLSFKSYLMS